MFSKKEKIKYLVLCVIAFSFLVFINLELFADSPTNLLCNGMINPDNLDDYTPLLSWTFYDSGLGDYQTAYQIRIGTTTGASDIWDSGEVSSLSEDCAYDGPQLNANTTYHWSVRVRDQNLIMSNYSADALFFILDIGLRAYDGTNIVKIAVDDDFSSHGLRIFKNSKKYGLILIDSAELDASKILIQTSSGKKYLKKIDITTDLPSPAISGILMGIYNTVQSFTITGESEATIDYSIDNGATWSVYSSLVTLNEGEYNIMARQTLAGEVSTETSPAINVIVDLTPPTLSIGEPSVSVTDTGPVTYTVTYSGADNVTLTQADITLNKTGTATGTISVSGTGNTERTVTISSITGNGTIGISIAAGTASDNAGNSAMAQGPSSTFNVINTTYSVTYNGNGATGGSVPTDTNAYLTGEIVVVLDNTGTLIKPKYSFEGWNTQADGNGITYTQGSTFTMGTSDITLYAIWDDNFAIGDNGPAGGFIFYDKGSESNGWRYLEAAPLSTEWFSAWGVFELTIPGADGTAIGTGAQNTADIIAIQGTGDSYAAQLCDGLSYGGYDDWFLPAKDELNLMYENLKENGIGDFNDYHYWSSSEVDSRYAWFQLFNYGPVGYTGKSMTHWVRAVRAF